MSDSPAKPVKVSPEERLFSLVLALIATDQGLGKEDILSSVQGYRSEFRLGGDNSALERKFERDKNGLRELGVAIETVEDPANPGNNQTLRYRIPRGAYELPADVTFDATEIALLNLAGKAWQEGSLSAESRRALVKLASLGVAADDPMIGYAPQIRVREKSFEPLSAAVLDQTAVRFPYLKPGETEAMHRTVEPLALVQHQGRWHLYAFDRERSAPRTFLLSRIAGDVVPVKGGARQGGAIESPLSTALGELDELWLSSTVVVTTEPGSDAETRLGRQGARRDDGALELHYTDEAALADLLAGFGPEVQVLGPESVARAVRSRLEGVLAAHAPRAAARASVDGDSSLAGEDG